MSSPHQDGKLRQAVIVDDDIGLTAKSQYTEVREVGRGGFGRAILVRRHSDGRLLIVKEVDLRAIDMQGGQKIVDLAKQEAFIMANIRHPNIVRVYGSLTEGCGDHIFRLVMEYCEAGDLQRAINDQKGSHFAERQIREWAAQLTLTLKYLHDRNILHRDIKPSNVFLSAEGRLIKLGDFGTAKIIQQTGQGASTGITTPTFSAPEFCEGKPNTAQSEAWALGVLIYNLSALTPPFEYDGQNILGLALAITRDTPKPLPSQYSAELHDFVAKLLEKSDKTRLSISEALMHPFLLSTITDLSAKAVTYSDCQSRSSYHDILVKEDSREAPQIVTVQIRQNMEYDSTSVFHAVETGDVDFTREVASTEQSLDFLAKIRADDETGDNPLHRATRHGQTAIVELLLSSTPHFWPDAKNKKDDAAIHIAAARGFSGIITVLAKADANLNLLGGGGDNFDALGPIIGAKFADMHKKDVEDGLRLTALHTASCFGHLSTVETLVKLGADVTICNTFKALPILTAAAGGHSEIVDFYLKKGINIESKSGRYGRTPLHSAAVNNRINVAKLLLRQGADVNAKQDEDNRTPLCLASSWGFLKMVKLLIDFGAEINPRLKNGVTPLGDALSRNNENVEVVEFLIDKGADVCAVKWPLFLVTGQVEGRPAWHYVRVDIRKFRKFVEITATGSNNSANISEYGTIVQSGWGERPPPEIDEIMKNG